MIICANEEQTELMEHAQRQHRHEDLYRKTVQNTIEAIESGRFSKIMVPRILEGLRSELGQCIELLLISPEFYSEQMEKLQIEVSQVMNQA